MSTSPSWTPSWIAPPQPTWSGDFALPTLLPFQLNDQTLRQPLRLSLGGERLRIEFSNEHGSVPLRLAASSVARAGTAGSARVLAGSTRALRFGGEASITIPPGARAVSDPVDLPTRDLERLAVSLYVDGPTAPSTFHWEGREIAFLAPGDRTAHAEWPDRSAERSTEGSATGSTEGSAADSAEGSAEHSPAGLLSTRVFLSAVLVERRAPPVVVVALGDSITDGNGATPGADRRWPDRLAERLAPRGVAVLNAGNSGGRLLSDGMGRAALTRMPRDVLGHAGVRAVVVLLGTNDIGWPGGPFAPQEAPMTADRVIAGLRQLAAQAAAANVRVIVATIPPNEEALAGTPLVGHHSEAKDRVRQDVNAWIREHGARDGFHGIFDGVFDVDALLRDPARPSRLAPAMDSGDHLHPGDAGYARMAEALDLDALLGERP